jgi:hypothetical protein
LGEIEVVDVDDDVRGRIAARERENVVMEHRQVGLRAQTVDLLNLDGATEVLESVVAILHHACKDGTFDPDAILLQLESSCFSPHQATDSLQWIGL